MIKANRGKVFTAMHKNALEKSLIRIPLYIAHLHTYFVPAPRSIIHTALAKEYQRRILTLG